MPDLIPIPEHQVPGHLLDQAQAYGEASTAPSTKRAYAGAWKVFLGWAADHDVDPLPAAPEIVAAFVADQAGTKKVATIEKYVAAINEVHRLLELEPPSQAPQVRLVLKGIGRTHGTAQKGKAPLLVSHLRRIVEILPGGTIGARDRALLLVGFAGAFRRSELVGLDVEHLDFQEDGLVITVARSKTDQEGAGRLLGIPYGSNPTTCPIRALRRWLKTAEIEDGPVFRAVNRHGHVAATRLGKKAVARVVKKAVALIGLEPSSYGGHSCRAGLVTEAAKANVGESALMSHTGHRSPTSLRGYIRHASLFVNNAAAAVGL